VLQRALTGVPWFPMVSKRWCQKGTASKVLAEMQRSYNQGKGGIVGFGC